MKVPLEILVISLLLIIGWRQPFREHAARILPTKQAIQLGIPSAEERALATRRAATPPPPPATPRDASWMWQGGTLDRKPERVR